MPGDLPVYFACVSIVDLIHKIGKLQASWLSQRHTTHVFSRCRRNVEHVWRSSDVRVVCAAAAVVRRLRLLAHIRRFVSQNLYKMIRISMSCLYSKDSHLLKGGSHQLTHTDSDTKIFTV